MDIERIYDLKGSIFNRKVPMTKEQMEYSGLKVLKDLNYKDIKEGLNIEKYAKNDILKTLEEDALFLSQQKMMDYSLLFIKYRKREELNTCEMPALCFQPSS